MRQPRATKLHEDIENLFSKISYYGVFDGHGGARAADFLLDNLHKHISNQESFAKGS